MRAPFVMLTFMTGGGLIACSVASVTHKCGLHGCPGDAAITRQVQTAYRSYGALQPPNLIRVVTLDRVVYLTGQVNTGLERDLAESVARKVPGVQAVVDSISTGYEGR